MPENEFPESDHAPSNARLKTLGIGVGLIALAVAAVGIGARLHSTAALRDTSAASAIADVAVVRPQSPDGGDDLYLPGNVQAFNSAAINARTNGYVKRWLADIGDHVRAGQALAILDAPDVDQQLAQAEADYQTALANQHLAETTARRWSNLLSQDAVSHQEADEKAGDLAAKSALAHSALANVKRLRATQGFETLMAPFDGVVTSRSAQIGALVVAGNATAQPLFTVSDVHRMRIYVRVPQNASAMIHPGITAQLELPEYPGRKFPAVLERSSGSVDAQSGAVLVELDADNADNALKPGAYAQVHFASVNSGSSLALPGSAVMYGKAGPSVAVVDKDGVVTVKPVTIARDEGAMVLISVGVSLGDVVIDTPPDAVASGDKVRVTAHLPGAIDQARAAKATQAKADGAKADGAKTDGAAKHGQ